MEQKSFSLSDYMKAAGVTGRLESDSIKERRRAALKAAGFDSNPVTQALDRICTEDPTLMAQKQRAHTYAGRNENVLITGETGTGKELFAAVLAAGRVRYDEATSQVINTKPLSLNCAGLTDTLFESLMFGHVKGAFTGAVRDHTGLLVAAGDGTVFLDEIGELPLNQQAKLLRAIEYRRVTPVGAVIDQDVRARFVFATNRSLPALVRAGHFRADLYYRIAQLELRTTPLRNRTGDAYVIACYIASMNDWTMPDNDIPFWAYADGNVRQLYNMLLRREITGLSWDELCAELGTE